MSNLSLIHYSPMMLWTSMFLNQSMVPQINSVSSYNDFIWNNNVENVCLIGEDESYLYSLWLYVLIYLVCFCMAIFSVLVYSYIFCRETIDILDDMRSLLNEISELSMEKREELSERYYILTNVLVNKFRIHVYEKMLK